MENTIKILQIGCSNFGAGGRSIIIYNLCNELNPLEYNIRFYADSILSNTKKYELLLNEKGWGIEYCIVDHSNYFKREISTQLKLIKLFRKNKYDIVHINADTAWEAMKFIWHIKNSSKIIVHAHQAGSAQQNIISYIKKPIYNMAQRYISRYTDKKLACSKAAATYLFGQKYIDNIELLNNAIYFNKFKYDENKRMRCREQLGITHELILGFVGRLEMEKNPIFLLNIFNELLKLNNNWKLLIVGDGSLKSQMEKHCKNLAIDQTVIFLGNRLDVNDIYQAMDAFILPSLHEGFGIVNIEAQASGLPCYISDTIPSLVKINDNLQFISVKQTPIYWAKQIANSSLERIHVEYAKIIDAGFDLAANAVRLDHIYKQLVMEDE